jgi:photosynthetic reaction center cytochrome c subunit
MRFLATALLLTAIALSAQDAPKQDAAKKGGGGRGGPPKNLKVLKPEDVRPVMGAMMGSLGQRCDFCHVQGANDSDDKPTKVTARKMMEMVNHINSMMPDAKVKVTCYTCHRGKNLPESAPPPATPGQ